MIGLFGFSQTTIYSEDFSGQNGKGASGTASGNPNIDVSGITSYSIDVTDTNLTTGDYFRVENGDFEGSDLDGLAIFTTSLINIADFTDVSFTIDVSAEGTQEDADFLNVEYSIDGGSFVLVQDWNGQGNATTTLKGNVGRAPDGGNNDWRDETININNLSGSSLVLKISIINNQDNEKTRIERINVEGTPVIVTNDETTEVIATTIQEPGATVIAANTTTLANKVDALSFTVADPGSGDGEPTNITGMRFVAGNNNSADWSVILQDIVLEDENNVTYSPTTIIDANEVFLNFSSSPIVIADGSSLGFTLGFYLNTIGITDEDVVQFQINANSSGFTANNEGSKFISPLTAGDIVGNEFLIDVVATNLAFAQQPSNVVLNDAMAPDVVVVATDVNGSIDTEYTLDIEITSSGDLATSPLTQTASMGTANFSNILHTATASDVQLTASDGSLNVTSSSFDVLEQLLLGWQITQSNTDFMVNFDTTVDGVNEGAYKGFGFQAATATIGRLDANAWATTGMSGDTDVAFGENKLSGDFARGNNAGSVSNGGFYAFETSADDFSFGVQPSTSDFTPGTVTLRAQNRTGSSIGAVDISYILYVLNDEERSNEFNFSYSVDNGTYTNVASLDYTSPTTPDASPEWSTNTRMAEITGLSIPDGAYFYLRWETNNEAGTSSGGRDQFALDDITVNFEPEIPTTFTFSNGVWSPENPNTNTPSIIDNVVIETGDALLTSDLTFNNVTVNPGASLSLDADTDLTATDILLESNATAYASFVLSPTANVFGNVKYERYTNVVGSGTTDGNDLISLPLLAVDEGFDNFLTFGETPATLNSNVLAENGTVYLFGPYNNTTGAYENFVLAETQNLERGKGYRAATETGQTLTFEGTVETGNITRVISNPVGGTVWNLIGNPYPSYLKSTGTGPDTDFFLNATNALALDEEAVAIYGYSDGTTSGVGTIGNFTIINNATNSSVNIAPGQGFFVAHDAANNTDTSVTFSPDMATTVGSDDFILGRNAEEPNMLRLKLESSDNDYATEIYFNSNASLGLDPGFDAAVMGAFSSNLLIYSNLVEENEGRNMAIQTLDEANLNDVTVPLGVKASQGQQLTFSLENMELPEGIEVYLNDTQANTSVLLNNSDYVITSSTFLDGTGRFFLRIANSTLSNSFNELKLLNIFTSRDYHEIFINGQVVKGTTAMLYDLQGRLVQEFELNSSKKQQRLDVSALSQGIYILNVDSETSGMSKKIILK